ncbi:hypothetical protein CHS0354_043012 [Potamilus streckersoni]|uniref:Uncharacterized protein n=1 Tax=Potamilus streckersoni TaxID=2493646 RepID=A0AAE0W6S3_9BIVA|nr:hypothetical protein CHS0354_043012 [Potamilus streckersoni]
MPESCTEQSQLLVSTNSPTVTDKRNSNNMDSKICQSSSGVKAGYGRRDVYSGTDTNLTLACLVLVCFNLPLGAVSMYLSLMAAKAYKEGLIQKGDCRVKASVLISLFSIVTTVCIVTFMVLWVVIQRQKERSE